MHIHTPDEFDMGRDSRRGDQRRYGMLSKLRIERWITQRQALGHLYIPIDEGTTREVDRDIDQCLVEGVTPAGETLHADLVAECFGNRLTERDRDVFHRVVTVDVEVSARGHTKINASVSPELVEHVIEKGQPGSDLGGPSAIEIDVHLDGGLGRVS